jgi:acetyl esterase/lipase
VTGLPPLRPGYPADAALLARRARMPAVWTPEMLAPGIVATNEVLGGIACLVCGSEGEGTILYFHGGGYRLGAPAAWAGFASRLAAATGKRVVAPDYRLAPEYPLPAALYDAIAVYRAMLGDGEAPFVGGDSAGGGLAAALALACGDLSLPKPRGLILLSPWLDLTCGGENRAGDPDEAVFPRGAAVEAAAQYLQGHDPADRLASPLFGDLTGFPPVLLCASGAEYLLDDALALRTRLADAGARVEAHIRPGLPHVWPVLSPDSPEARLTLDAIARFTA